MEKTFLNEASWQNTFPHRVMPMPDECLPGLLLRCDEVNHWGSRTTLTHLLAPGPEKFHHCWRAATPNLTVIQPRSLNLDYLAQLLAIPTDDLVATAYHTELTRLYDQARPHPGLLSASFTFHLCPQCIAEARLLRRTLSLSHITICPQHFVHLVERCQCGMSLHLFHRQSPSFTCYKCRQDWAELPWIKASLSQVELEQKYLSWYAFFFLQETSLIRQAAQYMMMGFSRERLPLGRLLTLLVQSERFPQDVLNWMDRASPLQKKGMNASAYRRRNTSQRKQRD